jgi:type IV secretory pathway component VirB8
VENCESYTLEGAPRRYAVCSALSAGHAQSEYQAWFQHDTTNSPQWRLKDQGFVYAEEVPASATLKDNIDTCHKRDFCEAELSYWLIEKRYGQTAQPKKYYTVTLDFIFVDELPVSELVTFNPASLKVISIHKNCTSCGKAGS